LTRNLHADLVELLDAVLMNPDLPVGLDARAR
jgi:hypothetical protein